MNAGTASGVTSVLAVGLVPVARDLCDELVRADAGRGGERRLFEDAAANLGGDGGGGVGEVRHIQVGFVEREGLDELGEAVKDLPYAPGLRAIGIEPGGKDDEVRAFLQGHVRRHGGADAVFARLVVAGGEDAAPIPRTADGDRLARERGRVAHFDGGVEAIHIEVDDGAWRAHGNLRNPGPAGTVPGSHSDLRSLLKAIITFACFG